MPSVSEFYLKALLKHARLHGINDVLLDELPGKGRIDLSHQDRLWEILQARSSPLFGFSFGQQIEPADLGIFGHLLMSASNLGEAIDYLIAFYPLISDAGSIKIEKNGQNCLLSYQPFYHIATELRVTAVLANLISTGQKMALGKMSLLEVNFTFTLHQEVRDAFENFSQTQVNEMQLANGLKMPISSLDVPLEHANKDLVETLLPVVQTKMQALSTASPIRSAVHFIEHFPSLSRTQLADKMKISERTLCRYLNKSGTCFSTLKRDAGTRFAQQALRTGHSVEHIAEQLNYSDASAFIKAFKNWTGVTPLQFKLSTALT